MIKTLLEHQTDKNKCIVDALIDFIEYKKISSVEELKSYQEVAFSTPDANKQILFAKHIVNHSLLDLDNLEYEDSTKVYMLKRNLNKIRDNDEIIKNIIIIFALTEKNIMFYFDAYNYILEGKL